MHVVEHHSLDELHTLWRGQGEIKLKTCLRAVILARRGWTYRTIAEALGASPRTVQAWIGCYNREALNGLQDRRGGNHRHLTAEHEQELCAHLNRLAEDPHDGIQHARQLQTWISHRFGKLYSISGLYELLHRLGYSWLMPRPRHPQADPAAQEEFKKKR